MTIISNTMNKRKSTSFSSLFWKSPLVALRNSGAGSPLFFRLCFYICKHCTSSTIAKLMVSSLIAVMKSNLEES